MVLSTGGLVQLFFTALFTGWMPFNLGIHRAFDRDNVNATVLTILLVVGFLRALWSVYMVRCASRSAKCRRRAPAGLKRPPACASIPRSRLCAPAFSWCS